MLHLPDDVACTWEPQTTRHNFMAGIRTPQDDQKDPRTLTKPWMAAILQLTTLHCITRDRFRESIASDEDPHLFLMLIEDGVPQSHDELPPLLRPYHQYREQLYSTDGVILYKGPCRDSPMPPGSPVHAPLCPPGHNLNDRAGRIFCLLARDHLSYQPYPHQLLTLQPDGTIPT